MDTQLRAVTADEFDTFLDVDAAAFGTAVPDPDRAEDLRGAIGLDRTRAVFEGGRMVAASATVAFELTLPGRTTVPAAGVTWVGVLPTHRRRGHLRRMMTSLLDDAAARREPVAILLSSQSLLYGRFGFGPATSAASVEIDSCHGAMLASAPGGDGGIDLVDAGRAAEVLPPLLDRARLLQPGDVGRPAGWWAPLLRDLEQHRKGAGPQFHAVHSSPGGEADGYAIYRVQSDWHHGSPRGQVLVGEVVGLTPGAEADLWRYLLSIDLTEAVVAASRPVDDLLRWLLVDPRRLRVTTVSDFLWVRLVDVAAALGARRYAVVGSLVLDVADAARPASAGRYRLEGGPDGAECRRSTGEADVSISVEDLGALYLGGAVPSTLAAAGRVVEHRPGALQRADAMFVSHPAPFCRTGF